MDVLRAAEDGLTIWYRDADADGFGLASMPRMACMAPAGHSATAGDCDDTNAAISPGDPEVCDSLDNDCDGTIDDGVIRTFYRDVDGDGWGVASPTATGCTPPAGFASNGGDCNDARSTVHPTATEVCDGFDTNCAAGLDFPGEDDDGDGHGDSAACGVPTADDCLDTNALIYGGAPELCDRLDNDCSSGGGTLAAEDMDADGYAPTGSTCTGGPLPRSDCNDNSSAIRPGLVDGCGLSNAIDNDCDAGIDEDAGVADCCTMRTRSYACGSDTCSVQYAFCRDDQSWSLAGDSCTAAGLDLVRIDDAAENAYVTSEAIAQGLFVIGHVLTFTGGNDVATDGTWVWRDGTLFWVGDVAGAPVGRYVNWAADMPVAGGASAAAFGSAGTWFAQRSTLSEYYVCEHPTRITRTYSCATGTCTRDYDFLRGAADHASAAAMCAGLGARMPRIDDLAENDWVRANATARGLSVLWLGGSDAAAEGTWIWPDGAQFWSGGSTGSPVSGLFFRIS